MATVLPGDGDHLTAPDGGPPAGQDPGEKRVRGFDTAVVDRHRSVADHHPSEGDHSCVCGSNCGAAGDTEVDTPMPCVTPDRGEWLDDRSADRALEPGAGGVAGNDGKDENQVQHPFVDRTGWRIA